MAAAASIAIANGALAAGALLLALTALPDVLDGAVAKASGTASPRGAFFDSVMDRVSDALLLGGVAWYLSTTEPGRISILPVAVMAGSLIVSYERAKAEALGFDAKGGLMERAERLLALGIGLLFSSLLIGVLWFMLAATLFTVGQRFVKVWRQASKPVPDPLPEPRPRRARRTARPSERVLARRDRKPRP
jgi:CDP-diacylglycerol--glycerol-3-phosphate 3-phosphatidyltransferase